MGVASRLVLHCAAEGAAVALAANCTNQNTNALGGIVTNRLLRGSMAFVVVLSLVSLVAIVTSSDSLSALATNTFVDDDGNIHEANIEYIAAAGVTRGCNPPANTNYCPSGTVTRGQMAAFLVRALELPPTSVDFFVDDSSSIFQSDINRLAASGITLGCNPPANTNFCPNGNVTRGQMAAFLKRGFNLPGTNTDFFVDDSASIFEGDINRLAASGITLGCNPPANTNFCPNQTVKRDQMASFLARALKQGTPPPTTTPPTTVATSAIISQTSFQIFNSGTEAGATPAAPINTPGVVALDTPFSLRFGMSNTGTASLTVAPKLQYRYIGAKLPGPVWSVWTDVTASSERVQAAPTGPLTDGQATTERLAGPLAFVAGKVDEADGSTGSGITLAPDRETEFVFSVKLLAPSSQNDQYEFRLVVSNGAHYNAYGEAPSVNLPYTFANGFDSGTAGAIITPAGSANPNAWSGVIPLLDPGAPRYDGTVSFEGPLSAKFDRMDEDPASYLRVNDFNQGHDLYGRLYFRYAGIPDPDGTRIVDVVGGFENGDSNSHSITLTGAVAAGSAGQITIKAGGAVGPTGAETNLLLATKFAVNTWYRIEWHATTETKLDAGDGHFEVRLYNDAGTLLDGGTITGPLAYTKTEFEDADFGARSQTVVAWIDEVAMSNTGWIGE